MGAPNTLCGPGVRDLPALGWAGRGREGRAALGWREVGWAGGWGLVRMMCHPHPWRPVSALIPKGCDQDSRGRDPRSRPTDGACQHGWGFVWFVLSPAVTEELYIRISCHIKIRLDRKIWTSGLLWKNTMILAIMLLGATPAQAERSLALKRPLQASPGSLPCLLHLRRPVGWMQRFCT